MRKTRSSETQTTALARIQIIPTRRKPVAWGIPNERL